MRPKTLYIILAALVAIAAGYWISRKITEPPKLSFVLCTRLPLVDIKRGEVPFSPNDLRKWQDHKPISVWFEAGNNKLTNSIISTANEWNKYCAIKFYLVDKDYKADVRVTIKTGGCASAIGRECMEKIYDGKFTMFLEKIDTLDINGGEFKRIVLHEFGHVLGIEHELRKPGAAIPWNKQEVYNYYYKKYHWATTEVDKQLFQPFQPQNKKDQGFDRSSIMVYAISPPLTLDNYAIEWPSGLSEIDKKGIAKWYPK